MAVKDIKVSSKWYGQLLGIAGTTPLPELAQWQFPHGGALQVYQLPERAGHGSFTLAVSDIAAQIEKLDAMGLDTSKRSSDAKVKTVMGTDPDGNHIAFAEAAKTHASSDELAKLATNPFPGESIEYHAARRTLLAEEIEFRRHMTRLAEQRRALPAGPIIARDYRFHDANGIDVGLIELFGGKDTLVTYFWMYGPQRERPCPMCTNWLGAVNGNANDIAQRVSLKILGRSPVERQVAFAQKRGWQHLDFVQTIGDDYANDLGLINADGTENPALVVYRRDAGKVRLSWSGAMKLAMADPGQDPRDAPDIASLWNILDLTPEGRGTHWYPKLEYSQ